MTLTHRQIEIATQIDQDVRKAGQKAKTLEAGQEAVINLGFLAQPLKKVYSILEHTPGTDKTRS